MNQSDTETESDMTPPEDTTTTTASGPVPEKAAAGKPASVRQRWGIGAHSKSIKIKDKLKVSKSLRAEINFPVSRFSRHLKKGPYAERLATTAPVYMAAVIEYLIAEICEIAGNITKEHKKKIITPRFINLAVQNDEELSKLWKNVLIPNGGVVPHIHTVLLPKKSTKKKTKW